MSDRPDMAQVTPRPQAPRGELPLSWLADHEYRVGNGVRTNPLHIENKGGTVLFVSRAYATEEHAAFIIYAANHIEATEDRLAEATALLEALVTAVMQRQERISEAGILTYEARAFLAAAGEAGS